VNAAVGAPQGEAGKSTVDAAIQARSVEPGHEARIVGGDSAYILCDSLDSSLKGNAVDRLESMERERMHVGRFENLLRRHSKLGTIPVGKAWHWVGSL
jgi:hypothetical protein